jgi:hypothetical protein
MTTRRIRTACYCAYLHDATQQGLLVLPLYAHDVEVDRGSASLMAADEAAMLERLEQEGYGLSLDQHGQAWATVGITRNGREGLTLAAPTSGLDGSGALRGGGDRTPVLVDGAGRRGGRGPAGLRLGGGDCITCR